MNHFLFFSLLTIYFTYLNTNVWLLFSLLCAFLLRYKYKSFKDLFNNFLLCVFIIIFSYLLSKVILSNNIEFMYKFNGMQEYLQGIYEFQVEKVRSSYIILKNRDFKVIISRNKVKNYDLIEGDNFVAFAKMNKIDQLDGFYLSNKIVYKIESIDVIEISKRDFIVKIRKRINDLMGRIDKGEIIKGIVWGMEDYSFYQKKELIEAGIYHFFVASGSNILLAMNLGFYVIYWFLRNKFCAWLFSLIFVLGYCFIVGFDPPLLRAFIFACFTNFFLIYKSKEGLYFAVVSGSLIWLLFLFIDFYSTLGLSFKLSLLTFIGVVILAEFSKRNVIYDNLITNIGIILFSFPIFMKYFGLFFINGIWGNVIVAFLVPFVFYLGIIYVLIPPSILILKYFFSLFAWIVQLITSIDPITFNLQISDFFIILYYFFMGVLLNGRKNIITTKIKK